jgi:hypothetical protein
MRYHQFRDAIRGYLRKRPDGATWAELRDELKLAYRTPCYTWIYRLENEAGLRRAKGRRGMVWTVDGAIERGARR